MTSVEEMEAARISILQKMIGEALDLCLSAQTLLKYGCYSIDVSNAQELLHSATAAMEEAKEVLK